MRIFNVRKITSSLYNVRQRFLRFKADNLKKNFNPQFFKRFLLFSFILILILCIIYIVLYFFTDSSKGSLKYNLSVKVKEIKLNIPMGNIKISSWNKDYVGIDYHFNQGDFSKNQLEAHFEQEGQIWVFTWQKEFLMRDFQEKNLSNFDIYLPINFNQAHLNFFLGYGNISLIGLTINELHGILSIGNITLASSEIKGLVEVGLGNIIIQEKNNEVEKVWQSSTGFSVNILSSKGILNLKTYTGRVFKETQLTSISWKKLGGIVV